MVLPYHVMELHSSLPSRHMQYFVVVSVTRHTRRPHSVVPSYQGLGWLLLWKKHLLKPQENLIIMARGGTTEFTLKSRRPILREVLFQDFRAWRF